MRTVVENRYGLNETAGSMQNIKYVHLNQQPSQFRSCFYDFGERRQLKFIASSDDERSEYIEVLMKRFLS